MKPFSSKEQKFAHANASSTTAATTTKGTNTSLLQCITLQHNTSRYSYNCRERPEVPGLVMLAGNMKVPFSVDFFLHVSIILDLASVVKSHSQLESSSITKHTIVDLINPNV